MSKKEKEVETSEYLEKDKRKQERRTTKSLAKERRLDAKSIKESRWN
jgi:hypothetical protein|tara:strand:- start:1 stop:141 length:141 start_codon:yes stop_codon:yes gene_type:complete